MRSKHCPVVDGEFSRFWSLAVSACGLPFAASWSESESDLRSLLFWDSRSHRPYYQRSSTTTMAQLPQLSLLPGRRRLTCHSRHLLPPAAPASSRWQGSAPRSLSHRMWHPLPTPSPWTMASGQPDSGRATGGCGRATTARPPSLTVSTVGVI